MQQCNYGRRVTMVPQSAMWSSASCGRGVIMAPQSAMWSAKVAQQHG